MRPCKYCKDGKDYKNCPYYDEEWDCCWWEPDDCDDIGTATVKEMRTQNEYTKIR